MYGCVTSSGGLSGFGAVRRRGMGWYGGLGDDISTVTAEVLPMLMSNPGTSIGDMVNSFLAQFPTMKQADALSAAQNGMLSYIQTQQPAIPASVLASTIQQLGPSATLDSVTNAASAANVPQNLALLYALAGSGDSHGSGASSQYSVQIAQPQTIQAAQSTPIAIYTPITAPGSGQSTSGGGTFEPLIPLSPGASSTILPGPPMVNPQIPVAPTSTITPVSTPAGTVMATVDQSTGNVTPAGSTLPPSSTSTAAVPSTPATSTTTATTAATGSSTPAASSPFSLCFPGDPSGPISDAIPICTYTAIGAAIILMFFFMKK